MSHVISRIFSLLMVAIIGAAFGAAGTFGISARPSGVPLGLIVALVGCAAALLAVRFLAQDRWSTIAAALGMYAIALLFVMRGPGGSVVLPDTSASMIWLLGLGVIVLVITAWPDLRHLRTHAPQAQVPPQA